MERDRGETSLSSSRARERSPERHDRRRRRSRSPRTDPRRDDPELYPGEQRRRRSRSRDYDRNGSRDHGSHHQHRRKIRTDDNEPSQSERRFLNTSRYDERVDRSSSSLSRVDRSRPARLDQTRISGSPRPHHKHHRGASTTRRELPLGARMLSRHDFAAFKPLFAHYLDLQKGLRIGELGDDEVRGRWKSFVGKWNRGELAEGWYDPEVFARVASECGVEREEAGSAAADGMERGTRSETPRQGYARGGDSRADAADEERGARSRHATNSGSESEADEYGPPPPPPLPSAGLHQQHGPGIPSLQDLEVQREMDAEDEAAHAADLRAARKADRKAQKEQLDELAPRAEAGTRERQLEKRAAVNDKMRGFRDKSPGGAGAAEVPEGELMGGGDGADEYRRMLATAQKRKSEREVRREEVERALAAEREERVRAYKEKEDRTVGMLRELARQWFG